MTYNVASHREAPCTYIVRYTRKHINRTRTKSVITGLNNGLLTVWRQAITRTNNVLFPTGHFQISGTFQSKLKYPLRLKCKFMLFNKNILTLQYMARLKSTVDMRRPQNVKPVNVASVMTLETGIVLNDNCQYNLHINLLVNFCLRCTHVKWSISHMFGKDCKIARTEAKGKR